MIGGILLILGLVPPELSGEFNFDAYPPVYKCTLSEAPFTCLSRSWIPAMSAALHTLVSAHPYTVCYRNWTVAVYSICLHIFRKITGQSGLGSYIRLRNMLLMHNFVFNIAFPVLYPASIRLLPLLSS